MIQRFFKWLYHIFWKKPTDRPNIKEVIDEYVIIKFRGQNINLNKTKGELERWNMLSRFDRRAMAARFKKLEQKGIIQFVEIDGHLTCIKTEKGKKYENQKNFKQ